MLNNLKHGNYLADIHTMNILMISANQWLRLNFVVICQASSHIELLRGKKNCKIDLGHGLKKVGWLGLDQEIIKRNRISEKYS